MLLLCQITCYVTKFSLKCLYFLEVVTLCNFFLHLWSISLNFKWINISKEMFFNFVFYNFLWLIFWINASRYNYIFIAHFQVFLLPNKMFLFPFLKKLRLFDHGIFNSCWIQIVKEPTSFYHVNFCFHR